MKHSQSWHMILFLSLLTGCNIKQNRYEPPPDDLPCEWYSQPSTAMSSETTENFLWWKELNDPLLNELIQRAAEQNIDLQIAATRILEARLAFVGKSAENLPRIDASATYAHAYYNQKTLQDIVGCDGSHSKKNIDLFELGFDAEWELDLFGIKQYELNALQARIEASEENLRDVWVTLSAEIARNYIELRNLQQKLALNARHVESQKETYQITEELVDLGMSTSIVTQQIEEQVNTLLAQQPQLELAIDKTIYRLSILLGSQPGELFCELKTPRELPCLPINHPIGVPSDLLKRRADIRKAERELAAVSQNIGLAANSFFPRLTLRGFIGDITTHVHSLFNPARSGTWFAGPQLLMPIFNSRLIKQDIKSAKIQTQQALYEYEKTVLKALEETENAIASFHYELERNHYLERANQSAQEAYLLTKDLYERGLKSYLDVLVTEQARFNAEAAYAQSQTELLIHYIALYKALGGEWENSCCDE